MGSTISIGKQDFLYLREKKYFYIDKSDFIRQWWDSADDITIITRPRRFGKTLNMSMLNYFFSNQYKDRGDIFSGLKVWQSEKYRKIQGTYPVIFISFADVKQSNYSDAIQKVKKIIADVYRQHRYLADSADLTENERRKIIDIDDKVDDVTAQDSLKDLSYFLNKYYGEKVIILLDEYDTPMQEAYIHGYWDQFVNFMRGLFNATFKTNPYLERAMMTGITRVSKESVFSDLNNLVVITTTSEQYEECFGFTEKEVFDSLESFGMSEQKDVVKQWYDGFTFGSIKDIYNPWSITNFLKGKKLKPYWALTSSNGMISKLIQRASAQIKTFMEGLVNGEEIVVSFDEQIVFNRLDSDENAIWSLLLASGYLKVEEIEYRGITLEPWYHLSITNLETISMFSSLFQGWFMDVSSNYNEFVKALFVGDLKAMNTYMNDVALATFSSFDTGNHPLERSQPERFYHGFVLGLLVDVRDSYEVRSNEKTVLNAHKQIEDKNYDADLMERGIAKENIRHYGFAFRGKKVLIG